MKALVSHKPKDIRYEDFDDPKIVEGRDAIVRVTSTAICGSDLHIYNGLCPQTHPFVMGHEFIGVVEEVGPEVSNLKPEDRVVVPSVVACGKCWFCTHDMQNQCENSNPGKYGPEGALMDQKGGGILGYTEFYGDYNGGQAEYVRVPFADYGPRKVPEGEPDEKYLFLSDIVPTGWTAIEWAEMRGGESVAVFGCGPVGLMAQKAAWLHGASRVFALDTEQYRLDMSKKVANTETLLVRDGRHIQQLRDATEGRGPDVVIDAVGMEASVSGVRKAEAAVHAEAGTIEVLSEAISAVRRDGVVSVVGVYGTAYDNFPLGQIFDKGLMLRTGQAHMHKYEDHLMSLIQEGKLRADDIITHTLPLEEGPHGYEMFDKKEDNCVKVVLKP